MRHLVTMLAKADKIDRDEGMRAYQRYNRMMQDIAYNYQLPLERVAAAFVAMSPNNDYRGNLRSLVSLCEGVLWGWPLDEITVSSFKHCRDRAHLYLTGEKEFLGHAKGPKIRAFYQNIVECNRFGPVTIDGHIMAIWSGVDMTMQDAKVTRKQYFQISEDITMLASAMQILPHQLQAILWFTRKRTAKVIYDPQGDLLYGPEDHWKTCVPFKDIRPYPRKRAA